MRTYHVGLLKDGPRRLVVEVARSVDQLSCELWQYLGERQTTVGDLKKKRAAILEAVNRVHFTKFQRITVRKIHNRDYSAGC